MYPVFLLGVWSVSSVYPVFLLGVWSVSSDLAWCMECIYRLHSPATIHTHARRQKCSYYNSRSHDFVRIEQQKTNEEMLPYFLAV